MLKRSGGKRTAEEANIDITPLLDIVFIMLIFFIVTSTFIKEPGIDVNRPEAETAEDQRLVSILVAVSSENKIWINREEVQLDGVRAAIERLRRKTPRAAPFSRSMVMPTVVTWLRCCSAYATPA